MDDINITLTKEQVEKFIEICEKQFGKKISYEQACADGTNFVKLISLIYKPITKADYEKYSKSVDEKNKPLN